MSSVTSGLLLVVSFPPFELLIPPFVALVPFLIFVAERPTGTVGRWEAARGGLLLGATYFGLLLYWLFVALDEDPRLAFIAYTLTVSILAGAICAFAAALHYVLERTPAPLALAAATLWTAIEWGQAHLGDLAFPWLGLGTAVAAFPRVAGAADLVGARGLTFWIALVNGLIATGILALRAGRPARRLAWVTAAVVAVPAAYGAWRVATLELRPAARVGVVQPNISYELKRRRAEAVDSTLTALTALMQRIEPGSVDLVVWPEVTFPTIPDEALGHRIREMSVRVGAPIVVGAYATDRDGDLESRLYNAAFVIGPDGREGDVYRKRRLVPFVERVPFVDPAWLEPLLPDARHFGGLGRGRESPVFGLGGASYGVSICFESIFAEHARRYRRMGVDFLVNMTNDAWYGRESWHGRTTALWQHPAHSILRAIELRIGVARAANTGISLFVDPLGRAFERTEISVPDVRVTTVYTTDTTTLYARLGDWLATAATVAAVLLLGVARWGDRRAYTGA